MTLRRLLLIGGVLLILFLAMYSWNRRTRVLDELAANVGLEISGAVLSPLRSVQTMAGDFWNRYFDLVDVREENLRLKKRLDELEAMLIATGEEIAELHRLRALVQFPVDVRWRPLAARVLAGKMGPNAVLDSIILSRGYMTGARPGVPLVTNVGLVGRILRSSPHASTALLITDPGSRIAVFGQKSRAAGILKGQGMGKPLEVDFVQRDAGIQDGEILVTSGLDDKFPKGLPVARISSVAPSDYTQFMAVLATPLVDLQHLEEVLLLEKSGVDLPPEEPDGPMGELVGPPLPTHMAKAREEAAKNAAAPEAPRTAPVESRQTQDQPVQPDQNVTPPAPAPQQNVRPARPRPSPDAGNALRNSEGAPRYRIITP